MDPLEPGEVVNVPGLAADDKATGDQPGSAAVARIFKDAPKFAVVIEALAGRAVRPFREPNHGDVAQVIRRWWEPEPIDLETAF